MVISLKRTKVLFILLAILLLVLPAAYAADPKQGDFATVIDDVIDGMETLNDLEKENYKNALKIILTQKDLDRIAQRTEDYGVIIERSGEAGEEILDLLEEAGVLDKFTVARSVKKAGGKALVVTEIANTLNDGIEWIKASQAYNADPADADKDRDYSEKAFRFYSHFLPYGSLVFGMMLDTIEGTRERAEAEAKQKQLFDKIIEDYESRVDAELNKKPYFDRTATSGVVSDIFGDGEEEPKWHLLKLYSEEKIEQIAEYMQQYPDPSYNAYNAAAFLRMMKRGGPEKEAYLRNIKGGGPAGFAKHSPVYMTITDPLGHKYGVDPETKRLLCDDAVICSPMQKASDTQYIIFPSILNGTYNIQMVGYADGEYNFLFHGFNHNYEIQGKRKYQGYIHKGEVVEANLIITLKDQGYEISDINFMKIRDSYPIPADPETLLPAIDMDPFKVWEGKPCKGLLLRIVNSLQPRDPSTKEMLEEGKKKFYEQQSPQQDCRLPPRPEFMFFTNKVLDPSTVNKETFLVLDELNKPVDGFFEVSSSITFIPSRPIFGAVTVTLKSGNKGICSNTKVCLGQDYTFRYNGAEKTLDFKDDIPFEITSTSPAVIKNNFVLINLDETVAENITLSILAYKTYFPNTFIKLRDISPQLQYAVRESGENSFIDFYITKLPPYEPLNINITYSALAFGVEYYSRLDVSDFESYEDRELLKTFTKLEENIEANNPEIASLAQKIVGEEKNPFWKAYKLYNWMIKNIGYDYDRQARIKEDTKKMRSGAKSSEIPPVSALETLHKQKGVCYDYALLYIALARSVGVPSRMVILDVVSENGEVDGHSIVEIYLPRYGWIPLDPTWGTAFNNFAREEPFLFLNYKEDGITEPSSSIIKAINGDGLSLLESKEVFFINAKSDDDWAVLFQEPFFKDFYKLIFTSQIRNDLSAFEEYNQVLNQDMFAFAEKSKTSSVVLTKKAIDAYKNKEYEKVQNAVQELTVENVNKSLIPLLLNAKTVQEFVLEERAGTTEPEYYDQAIFAINDAINKTDNSNKLMAEQDYAQAINSFTSLSYPARSYLQRYSLNLVATDVYQKLVSSSFFAFGSASLKFWLLIIVFFLLLPAFWFWMMINCLLREKFQHLNKFWWFIIIFFITPAGLIPIGPTLYFFLEYRKRNKPEKRITK